MLSGSVGDSSVGLLSSLSLSDLVSSEVGSSGAASLLKKNQKISDMNIITTCI